jgi:beta-glucanase (GH16 family)
LYTYGYAAARIHIPANSSGLIVNWAAFFGDGTNWPTTGENDIFESLSGQSCWTFHNSAGRAGHGCTNAGSGWHSYAAEWTPGSVIYYFDGVQVGQISQGVTDAPMYLALKYGTGQLGGPVVVPATMQVTFVHVWQLK